jgi:mannose-6-phosphate isomerase-like protein (cupin superfamily)
MIGAMLRALFPIVAALPLLAVDPTFLRRHVPDVSAAVLDPAAPGCRYRAAFGAGDVDARQLKGVTRFGELVLDAGAACAPFEAKGEERLYVVLAGAGAISPAATPAIKKHDFLYVPPGARHTLSASAALRVLVMGFRVREAPGGGEIKIANLDDVPLQTVGSHPPSTQYRLLLGQTTSQRDRLACAQNVTSLFVMEFAAGGTNIPHHHETEEEIYYVLEGRGDMVAGGGADGLEGRYPSRTGDAWFFRLNTTVGFYSGNRADEPQARILAVRSLFPFPRR